MSRTIRTLASIVAPIAVLALAPAAHALERGDTCKLKSPLAITVKHKSGTMETVVEAGTAVEVVGVSDGGSARIRAGEIKGDVSRADLEGACSGTLRVCRLDDPVVMYEQNRSDSKSWRVKEGADVSVLKKGKTWAAVRVGDLRGFVKTDDITTACVGDASRPAVTEEAPPAVEEVERGEGPGVLFLPFALEGAAPAGNADALLDALYDRGAVYRPDAARLPVDESGKRNQDWKTLVAQSAKRAVGAATAYVIVGRLAMEPPKPDKPLEERNLLQLAVVDAKTGNVLKAVRIRPTLDARDNWTDKALASLLPSIAAAPNSKLPVLGGESFEVAPVQGAPGAAAPKKTEVEAPPSDRLSTFLNPWGWLTLAGAAALGVTGGYVGSLALDENERANNLSGADPEQAERRDTALTEAITADALGVAAVGVGVAGIVVFATRAGIGE